MAAAVIFTSCATTPPAPTITVDRLSELENQPALKARSVRIASRIERQGDALAAPSIVVKMGDNAKIEIVNTVVYPTRFTLATAKPNRQVSPATPSRFESKEIGLALELTPRVRGPFIELTGSLTERKLAGYGQAAGEVFSPIVDATTKAVLSDNTTKLPHFTADEYRVHAVGLPGEELVLEYNDLRLRLKCEVAR